MNPATQIAAALRDVADMVEALGLDDVQISAYIGPYGDVRVGVEPMHFDHPPTEVIRRALDDIAVWAGATLHAFHASGRQWVIHSDYDGPEAGRLPCGARLSVSRCVLERPLDLAPLPKRRRRTAGAP